MGAAIIFALNPPPSNLTNWFGKPVFASSHSGVNNAFLISILFKLMHRKDYYYKKGIPYFFKLLRNNLGRMATLS